MPAARLKTGYPSPSYIRAQVRLAKELGIEVAGIRTAPDGTLEIIDAANLNAPPLDEFDKLVAEGRL